MPNRNPEMLRVTVELLFLTALSRGPHDGFAIARWLEATSDDELQLEEGSLYPALHRMERRGWLEAEWVISENKRQVKRYRLTSRGRAQLRSETEGWTAFVAAIGKVLQAAQAA
ncbi:MAG: PadR family transcriptional regulator [Acidobacteriota bacterium]|nr:PadR family transcriptional regulator [Acidobacteriota bacterium]